MRFPSIFVSHGAPTLAIEDCPASRFLRSLGAELGRPSAILVISAHWETEIPTFTTVPQLKTVHDFGGFDPTLYTIRYEPPGATTVSEHAQALLKDAGFTVRTDAARGIDHGAWVPLLLMYPHADIPVAQLSVQPQRGAQHHLRLGQALRPLREEDVLILASGSMTHNLREAFRFMPGTPTPAWVTAFSEWAADTLTGHHPEDVINYLQQAPFAKENHPTPEHFLPLLVALGARSLSVTPRRVHSSVTLGVLAMDAYVFD